MTYPDHLFSPEKDEKLKVDLDAEVLSSHSITRGGGISTSYDRTHSYSYDRTHSYSEDIIRQITTTDRPGTRGLGQREFRQMREEIISIFEKYFYLRRT